MPAGKHKSLSNAGRQEVSKGCSTENEALLVPDPRRTYSQFISNLPAGGEKRVFLGIAELLWGVREGVTRGRVSQEKSENTKQHNNKL